MVFPQHNVALLCFVLAVPSQHNYNYVSYFIVGCGAIAMEITAAFRSRFRGAKGPASNIFYLYVTATINSMKISFNDV